MSESLTESIQAKYGSVAGSTLSNRDAGVRAVAEAFGYSADELARIPQEANMGLSCGNPTALASLRAGEVVVDLGSGGGLDVFLAAEKVGPTGRAIGIDMTPAMIARARAAARQGPGGRPYANVAFHLAEIDHIPLPDASVDCVISNCVINLAPDKPAVFREIARILKPGGRAALSDIALKKDLPDALRESVAAYVGCIAGAVPIAAYRQLLVSAGFEAVDLVDSGADLNAYAKVTNQAGCCSPVADQPGGTGSKPSGCCGETSRPVASTPCCTPRPAARGPALHEALRELLTTYDVNEYAASVKVFALKPR
jgi:SAM-dependent methyltransferase